MVGESDWNVMLNLSHSNNCMQLGESEHLVSYIRFELQPLEPPTVNEGISEYGF